MTSANELQRGNEALRDRIARLSAAILRISASLDVNTVLHEVVDTARALTGARYGAITTIDDAGQPQVFITSGITPEAHQQLVARANLEVLVDTSPVGVVVFDARIGHPARFR